MSSLQKDAAAFKAKLQSSSWLSQSAPVVPPSSSEPLPQKKKRPKHSEARLSYLKSIHLFTYSPRFDRYRIFTTSGYGDWNQCQYTAGIRREPSQSEFIKCLYPSHLRQVSPVNAESNAIARHCHRDKYPFGHESSLAGKV